MDFHHGDPFNFFNRKCSFFFTPNKEGWWTGWHIPLFLLVVGDSTMTMTHCFLSLFAWWIDEWHTLNAFVLACFMCNGCLMDNLAKHTLLELEPHISNEHVFADSLLLDLVICLEKPPFLLIQSLFYPQILRPDVRSPVERCDTYWWYDMTIDMASMYILFVNVICDITMIWFRLFPESFHYVGLARMFLNVGTWFQSPNSHSHGKQHPWVLGRWTSYQRFEWWDQQRSQGEGLLGRSVARYKDGGNCHFFLCREGWQKCWKTNSSSGWNYIVARRNVYMPESCLVLVHVAMAISWGDVHPLLKTSCDFDLNPRSHGVMLLQNLPIKIWRSDVNE